MHNVSSREPSRNVQHKTLRAMQAERAVKRITFYRAEANPGDTLYVSVPKLNVNEVLVPGSLALVFGIDLSGGHANNFLVQNVTRALVDRLRKVWRHYPARHGRLRHLQNL